MSVKNFTVAFIVVSLEDSLLAKKALQIGTRSFREMPKNFTSTIKVCDLKKKVFFKFDEVYYGSLIMESTLLISCGIPHSIIWNSGESFKKGVVHYRMNHKGEVVCVSMSDLHHSCLA